MKSFSTIFLASLVSFSMASSGSDKLTRKDNDNNQHKRDLTNDQRTCRKMYNINRAQHIVANTTRIEQIAKQDAGRAERIRELATKEGAELARLQQNKTLVEFCGVYRSHEQTVRQCYHIKNLEKLERRTKDRNAIEDTARKNHESPEQVRSRWQHDIELAQKQKNNQTMLAECDRIRNEKPIGKGSVETGKQRSSASTFGSSIFAVVLAGLFAGLVI